MIINYTTANVQPVPLGSLKHMQCKDIFPLSYADTINQVSRGSVHTRESVHTIDRNGPSFHEANPFSASSLVPVTF